MSSWQVSVSPGEQWLPLPLDTDAYDPLPDDPLERDAILRRRHEQAGRAATGAVAQIVPQIRGVDDVAEMSRVLLAFTQQAYESQAMVAAVLLAQEGDIVRAYLEAVLMPGDPMDLDELASQVTPRSASWSQTQRVDLPCGEALRVHVIDAEPSAIPDAVVTESVWHLVPAPDRTGVVALGMAWREISTPDELIEVADSIARTLVLEPADG